ncbi:thioredoxin family protein [Xanthomonas arboricola]|uniref:thioredoxin family protein n=1 Tax=Xanthomonas arboricola TaxID=56448 RepID=UPI000CEF0D49|nr:thioredoxin family protein [Xanthomonas arboricola]PPT50159.1 dihydroneopterin aldolase [Xanthomonas arboricola]
MTLSFRRPAPSLIALLAVLATLTACNKPATPPAPAQTKAAATPAPASSIAWREGDVEDAFAEARESGKPILLYWGAAWCPPCNRLKATLFKDPAFIARTQQFVAVHLDGDSEGAQAWGERFGIKGYPTIIVLRPDRSEITRLAGDADNARLADVLRVAAKSTSTARQLLDTALQTPQQLSADDWAVLGNYAWGTDDRLVKPEQAVDVLTRLSSSAPQPALQRSFALAAITAAKEPPAASAASRTLLEAVLADPAEVRANLGTLSYMPARLVAAASSDAGERTALSNALNLALDKVYADTALPIADRLGTAYARIQLARLAQGQPTETEAKGPQPPLPKTVVDTVQQRVQWATDTARTDEERQSTISTAAALLGEVGDRSGAEQLLLAELTRSKTPYYYMPELADLAEQRGDKKTALSWLRRAYESAQGPATRVQWGVMYVDGLIRLSPDDTAGIEAAATQVIGELAGQPDGYRQRTRQRFATLGATLKTWSKQHRQEGNAVLTRLQQKMQSSCDSKNTSECASWLS